MNDKLKIWNRLSDTEYEDVEIPFYYSMAGDERFMQDIFLQSTLNDCIDNKISEGNINKIPSGIIRLASVVVNTSKLTNRFVRGEFTKETDDGELLTYNAPHNLIALDLGIEVEIKTDSYLDLMKLIEKLLETFYKTHVYQVLYKGYVISCQVGFPEDLPPEKPYEFSFPDDTTPRLSFNLEIETWFPVADKSREFLKSHHITSFVKNISDGALGQIIANTDAIFRNTARDDISGNPLTGEEIIDNCDRIILPPENKYI